MLDFLSECDIFGQKVELKIGDDPEYKTKIGGLTTLSIVTILVLITYSGVRSFR